MKSYEELKTEKEAIQKQMAEAKKRERAEELKKEDVMRCEINTALKYQTKSKI